MKVRVGRPVANWLEGSQAWYERHDDDSDEHPDDRSLCRKIEAATQRKDGSILLDLTDDEVSALRQRADWLADCARDGIQPPQWSDGDTSALGEFNSATALMRQIDRLRTPTASASVAPVEFIYAPPVEIAAIPPLGVEVVEEPDEPRFTRHLRIYRAEDRAAVVVPGERLDGTLAGAQAYVDRIVRSAWWKRTCPPYSDTWNGRDWPVVAVKVTKGRQGGGLAFYAVMVSRTHRRGVEATIRLGHGDLHGCPAIADPWVILHELAHVMAAREGHRGHGRGFARYFLLIVRRWLGDDAAKALRAAYAVEKVKYRR